jgi:hypothetical protein
MTTKTNVVHISKPLVETQTRNVPDITNLLTQIPLVTATNVTTTLQHAVFQLAQPAPTKMSFADQDTTPTDMLNNYVLPPDV